MQDLPIETQTKNQTKDGTPIPADKMTEWGYPSSEHYAFAGSTSTRNTFTYNNGEENERTVLIIFYTNTFTSVKPNEKSATQLKKDKAMNKAGIVKPKAPTVPELKAELKALRLPVSGKKADLISRLNHFYNENVIVSGESNPEGDEDPDCRHGQDPNEDIQPMMPWMKVVPTTDDLFVDDEGEVINPVDGEEE